MGLSTSVDLSLSFIQILRKKLFFLFWARILRKKYLQVHIVYLGVKKHDDPDATKKSHYELLSHLLGRYEITHSYLFLPL